MLNPADLISLAKTVHSVAAGFYRAGEGMPKYRLYLELFSAAPSAQPLTEHQEDFVNFLVRARILLKDEDYQMLKDNIATVYTMQCTSSSVSSTASQVASKMVNRVQGLFDSGSSTPASPAEGNKANIERIDPSNFHVYLTEAERRYTEFSDAYEKISSKGYPTSASTIAKQIESPADFTQQNKTPRTVGEVNIDLYRTNLKDYFEASQQKTKKNSTEAEKEIDIEKTAITNSIDTKPIACKINYQVIYIVPRNVNRKQRLKNMIESRATGAVKALEKSSPPSREYIHQVNKGVRTYLIKKNAHDNEKFLNVNLAKVGKLASPGTMQKPFQKLPPEYAANVLAIIAILSDGSDANQHITKDMSISRMVTAGQINGSYKKPPLAANLKDAKDIETIKKKINEKAGPEEARKLIATLDAMQSDTLFMNAVLDNYITDVMYSDTAGKQPIESIIEFCEADATAKEYVKSTGDLLTSVSDYLSIEASKAQEAGIEEAGVLLHHLNVFSGNEQFNASPQGSPNTGSELKSERDRDPDDTDDDYYEIISHDPTAAQPITPLEQFSLKLEKRIEEKKSTSLGKTAKNILTGKTKQSKDKEDRTVDHLSEALPILKERLGYILKEDPSRHKTTAKDEELEQRKNLVRNHVEEKEKFKAEVIEITKRISEKSSKIEDLNNAVSKIDGEIIIARNKIEKTEATLVEKQAAAIAKKSEKNEKKHTGVTHKHDQGDLDALEEAQDDLAKTQEIKKAILERIKEENIALSELSESYAKKIDEIAARDEFIENIEDKIEQYEQDSPLENPERLVEEICNNMNNARTQNKSGKVEETKAQNDTQNEFFTQFHDALMASGIEGPALAKHMKDYVENEINQSNPAYPITIRTTSNPAASASSSGLSVKSVLGSPVLPTAGASSSGPSMKILAPTAEIELSDHLIKERQQLIFQIEALYNEKSKEKSSNPKLRQLEQALDYLRSNLQAHNNTIEQKYAEAAKNTPEDPNDQMSHQLKQRNFFGNFLGNDRTTELLENVQTHQLNIQKAHPDCFEGTAPISKHPIHK